MALSVAGLVVISVAAAVTDHVLSGSDNGTGASGPGFVQPADVVGVLVEPQQPKDKLIDAELAGVRRESTRFLGTTPAGRQYTAVDVTGHLVCLLTLAAEHVSEASCASLDGPAGGSLLKVGPFTDGSSVVLLRDDASMPAPWIMVGQNLAYTSGSRGALDDSGLCPRPDRSGPSDPGPLPMMCDS
jgi:hypothetical protein